MKRKQIKIKIAIIVIAILALCFIVYTKLGKKKYDGDVYSIYYSTLIYEQVKHNYSPILNNINSYVIIKDYAEYQKYYDEILNYKYYYNDNSEETAQLKEIDKNIDKDFFDKNSLLLFKVAPESHNLRNNVQINIDELTYNKDMVEVKVCGNYESAYVFSETGRIFFIPINKNTNKASIKINMKEKKGINLITSIDKPVIYLYPTETTNITVKVGKPENLIHTYPKYNGEWEVMAEPNGRLTDLETGRSLYCLYWEGKGTEKSIMTDGFVVKGEDTIAFLEEKLEILGLNEREANEFIIYWLPKLECNKYNYIRFETIEEINKEMPIEITPTPDTVIRVLMEYKELEEPIKVQEQKLGIPKKRSGFTVIEWGGTHIAK